MSTIDLPSLLKEARINEEKLVALQQMETKLLEADKFCSVCNILVDDYRRQFNLRAVTLTLVDRGDRIKNHIYADKSGEEALCSGVKDNVFLISDYSDIEELRSAVREAKVGPFDPELGYLFGDYAQDVESAVILPLVRKGEFIGVLSFGSVDPDRYDEGLGVDFLKRLSLVVAVCVQNAIQSQFSNFYGADDLLMRQWSQGYVHRRTLTEAKRACRHEERLALLLVDLGLKDAPSLSIKDEQESAVFYIIDFLYQALRDHDVCMRLDDGRFAIVLLNADLEGAGVVASRLKGLFECMELEQDKLHEFAINFSLGGAVVDCDLRGGKVVNINALKVEDRDSLMPEKSLGHVVSSLFERAEEALELALAEPAAHCHLSENMLSVRV